MSLFDKALKEHTQRVIPEDESKADSSTIGGSTVTFGDSETIDIDQGDAFLTNNERGIPRNRDAFNARQLGQTAIAESIKNVVIAQLTGGELSFPFPDADDDDVPTAVQNLREFFRALLDGPHYADDNWDDLVAAAVSDMVDLGNGYWETIAPNSNTLEIPVATFKPVPAITVQHNVDRYGGFEDPAYYQAPIYQFEGSFTTGGVTPTPLTKDDLISFRWPGSRRAGKTYPMSPMMQVQEWLELLHNSTTHHGRYYNDNEMPAGFLQVMQATDTDIEKIQQKMNASRGDPRDAPVIGGEGPANWIELGGQAINLNVIEEQQWFINLVLGAFGIPKQELALVDDVNRNTADSQDSMIFKRVAIPVGGAICDSLLSQLFPRFPAYQSLDPPFGCEITYSDPGQERAQEEHLRGRFESGALSYNEYKQLVGEDPGDTVVEFDGEEVDYGEHPWPVVEYLLNNASGGSISDALEEPQDGDGNGGNPPGESNADDEQDSDSDDE